MLKAHDYLMPERFLQMPLDASIDVDSFQRDKSTTSVVDYVDPVSIPFVGGRVVRWCWVNFQCRGVLQFGLQ